MDSVVKTLKKAQAGLETVSNSSSGGSHKGSGSSSSSGKTSGEGTAVAVPSAVVAAAQGVAAQQAYVRSDTTLPFTLKHGQAYCFKMTAVGTEAVPSFTVGNGDVLKTPVCGKGWQRLLLPSLCDRRTGPERRRLHHPAGPERAETVRCNHWLKPLARNRQPPFGPPFHVTLFSLCRIFIRHSDFLLWKDLESIQIPFLLSSDEISSLFKGKTWA